MYIFQLVTGISAARAAGKWGDVDGHVPAAVLVLAARIWIGVLMIGLPHHREILHLFPDNACRHQRAAQYEISWP